MSTYIFRGFKNDTNDSRGRSLKLAQQTDSPVSGNNGPVYNRRLGSRTYLVDEVSLRKIKENIHVSRI